MSMIQQADFLKKYNMTSADFKAANLNYDDLLNISSDFESKRAAYDEIGNGVVKILFKFDAVHAIKYQVKNSEELIYQLITYKLQNPEAIIDLTNYEELIENLISINIIPLFKSDWAIIHKSIIDQFVVIDNITANVRAEDAVSINKEFTDNGCSVKIQPDGYRSIDYVIKTAPSKKEYKIAVQVRSIFEEGWAAIDHSARYQNKMDDQILNEFSKTLNKLAGGADEMGEFIHGLKSYLKEKETLVQEQQTLVQEQQNELAELKAQLAQANLEKKEKEGISNADEKPLSNGSNELLGKSIIEDLAKTAAGVDGGSVPTEIMSEEKPKTVKNSADKPKVVKPKEEKIKAEKSKEEKPKLETVVPVVKDLFGQTRIPDAPPLKPSITNA